MNDKDKILAIDLINFKKLSMLLTGKNFNLRADRSFGSKEKEVDGLLKVIEQWMVKLNIVVPQSNQNSEQGLVSKIKEVNTFEYKKPVLESDALKIEQEVVDDKIEYDILESFPFGIEKIEDYGKNKSLYFYDQNYYTRVINEKAKHISYESADNYLKSK